MSLPPVFAEGVIVPFAQAGITGGLCGSAATFVALLAGWEQPVAVGGLGFSVGMMSAWIWYRREWARRADAQAGIFPPEPAPERAYASEAPEFKVKIETVDGKQGIWNNYRLRPSQFITWVTGVDGGTPLAQDYWCGAGNPFSRGEYKRFIASLMHDHVVVEAGKNHNAGYELTEMGKRSVALFARHYGNPLPRVERIGVHVLKSPTKSMRAHVRILE